MSDYRTITCSCGEIIRVSLSSAGEILLCPSCQKEIEVPSWRELKEYPVYTDPEPKSPAAAPASETASERDRRTGWMLVFGILMVLFTGLALYNGYIYYNSVLIEPEKWDFYTTWANWQFLRPGIDTPLTLSEQDWFFQLRELRRWIILFATVAVVCFVSLIFLWVKPYGRRKR